MKVATQQRVALSAVLLSTALIVLVVWWANWQVTWATANLSNGLTIARMVSQLRLLTSEIALNRKQDAERPMEQWQVISDRLDKFLADPELGQSIKIDRDRMLQRRIRIKAMMQELIDSPPDDERLNRLLSGQILIQQQDQLIHTYGMVDDGTRLIKAATARAFQIGIVGLTMIVLVTIGFGIMLHYKVIIPLKRLQAAARRTASGSLTERFDNLGDNELGDLGLDLETMTRTQQALMQKQLESNESLAVLNREMESFSYSVSHDLRGPLRSMDGFSLVLLEDYGDKLDAEGVDALQRIRAASQRMGMLIDDLLALSQVTRNEPDVRTLDLSALVREICAGIDQENTGTPVRWQVEEGMVLNADRRTMALAISNLLRNAWKFSSKSAQPTVEVARCQRAGRNWVRIRDNGVGFDMAYADRLFGAFQRLHSAGEFPGSGIGLAIVQRVMQRHGGEVAAESSPGDGATFYFHTGKPAS